MRLNYVYVKKIVLCSISFLVLVKMFVFFIDFDVGILGYVVLFFFVFIRIIEMNIFVMGLKELNILGVLVC